MNSSLIIAACLLAATTPEVEITPLQGKPINGNFISADKSNVKIDSQGKEISYKNEDLLSVDFLSSKRKRRPKGIHVLLVNQSKLICQDISTTGFNSKLESIAIGTLSPKLNQIRSIRFGRLDQALNAQWSNLLSRKIRDDMLIIKKENGLDFLTGVVGDINEKTIQFLIDDSTIPVKRTKVFGIIYKRDTPTTQKRSLQFEFTTGEVLAANSFQFNDTGFVINHAFGNSPGILAETISSIDLSAGRLKHLSQLEPANIQYSPCISTPNNNEFDIVFEYRKNENMYGNPIQLGNRTFARGICVHSDTTLTYRLANEFKRFQAVVGIDASAGNSYGNVSLKILGDGVPLYEGNFKGTEPEKQLDLDVSKFRMLEIHVGCGTDGWDIGDNLNFGDARLLK